MLLCGVFALFYSCTHGTEFLAGMWAASPHFVSSFAVVTTLLYTASTGAGFALKLRLA